MIHLLKQCHSKIQTRIKIFLSSVGLKDPEARGALTDFKLLPTSVYIHNADTS